MKPNFALDLTYDGIGLLHRGKGGWLLVDEIKLDDPELTVRLGVMRQTAVDLESGGFSSQLIIPASQILFTSMTASGPDDATREARIREGLVGLTPYAVEDLVFDWQADGDMAHVAVIARETLAEAEEFALENRLNPVCFSARPSGSFSREAYFGVTSCAGKFLRKGSKIQPDRRPIPELMGKGIPLAVAARQKRPDPAPSSSQTSAPSDVDQAAQTQAKAPTAKSPPTEAPKASNPVATELKANGKGQEHSNTSATAAVHDDATTKDTAELAPASDKPEPKKDGPHHAKNKPSQPSVALSPKAAAPRVAAQKAPAAKNVVAGDKASKAPVSRAKLKGAEKPHHLAQETPKPAPDVSPSFSTRRGPDVQPDAAPDDSRPSQQMEPRILVAPPSSGSDVGGPTSPQKQAHVPITAPNVVGTGEVSKTSSPKKRGAKKAKDTPKVTDRKGISGSLVAATGAASAQGSRTAKAASKRGTLSASAQAVAHLAEDTSVAGPVPKELSQSAVNNPTNGQAHNGKGGSNPAAKEAEALTVFGARAQQKVGGKPKFLALFLVLGLLLLMAVVAVWSMFFLSEQSASLFPDREDQFESAITTAPNTLSDDPSARETGNGLADADRFSEFDPAAPQNGDPAFPSKPSDRALLAPQTAAALLSPEAAETRYAATGIWERAPDRLTDPEAGRIDGLYVASIDPATTGHDAVALPSDQLAAFENTPADILPPPPSGTRFELDERGLVRATPQGSLTPEGVLVISGRPSQTPADRPGDAGPETTALPESTLPRIRPRSRPGGLVESNERELFGGRSRVEMAALRPAPRPQSITALTDQAAAISNAVANAAIDDAAAAAAAAINAPTQLAVAQSPGPKMRPKGFQKLVDAARAADASDGSVVVAAAPRNQTVTPKIPTRASVAKQATIKNAISLRKVSLIGIYGSSSKRRALVRLKSGRYVKVGIGDRLDGGKVVSISASKLVYKKGSRSNTLQILPFS